VKEKGLIFLNECGLDPGIDHIITMKLLDDIKDIKAEDKEYISYCGGVPSPDACDNCLGYKFSWSPQGALNALRNSAKYLKNSMEMNIPSESVLYMA
jgi:saccharopine dehydrogenase-like NADP-dependent oxidoreductase